jgi:hypothetical protein
MPTAEEPDQTEDDHEGDFRIRGDGKVEVFERGAWRLYRVLPGAGPGPIIRDELPPGHR